MGCCAKCDTGGGTCGMPDTANAPAAPPPPSAAGGSSRGFSAKTMDLQFLDTTSIPEFPTPSAQNQSVDPAGGGWTLAEGQLFGTAITGDPKSPTRFF